MCMTHISGSWLNEGTGDRCALVKEFAELVDLAARHGWEIPPDEVPLRRLTEIPVPRVVLPDLLAEAGEFGGNQFRH